MSKNLGLYILFVLTFIAFLSGQNVECKNVTDKKCPYDYDFDSDNDYNYTVDLTGVKRNSDGSYTYRDTAIFPSGRDTVIPANLVRTYSSEKFENGTEIQIREEIRGCICSIRKCLQICSHNLLSFYNNYKRTMNVSIDEYYTKNMVMRNGVTSKVHLIRDFHLFEKSICKYEYPLSVEQYPNDNWTLYEDGNLFRHSGSVNLTMDEYCFDTYGVNEKKYFLVNPLICGSQRVAWNVMLNGWAMLLSVPFIVLTIVLYSFANKLSSYEKCIISYLSTLALSYALHSFLIIWGIKFSAQLCQGLGFAAYFSVMGYLSWTCVTSYHIWNLSINGKEEVSFKKYFIVGWSMPILITLLTYVAEIFVTDYDLRPGINAKRFSAFMYFYGPCILAVIYSCTMYTRVRHFIKLSNHSVEQSRVPDPHTKRFRVNYPMFCFMCITWIFDILSYFQQIYPGEWIKKIFFIADIINASQGILIFLMFISKNQFRNIIWQRFVYTLKKKSVL